MHTSLKNLLLATALQEYDSNMNVGELISMLKEEIAATGKEFAGEVALEYYINSVSKERNTDSDIKSGIGAMKKALVVEKKISKQVKRDAKKKMISEKKRLETKKLNESKKKLKLAIDTANKVANKAMKEADKSHKRAVKEVVKAERCAEKATLKAKKKALKKRNNHKYKNS